MGTAGSFPKPDNGKQGEYFNDVNGKRGATADEVRAGLSDLMMITGSLHDAKINLAWPVKLWQDLVDNAYKPPNITILGKVTLAHRKLPQLVSAEDRFNQLLSNLWTQFLGPFMRSNGQLPYIERQSWYKKGRAVVDVDINFYLDRGYGAALSFHKDTAGDNLFVNLIFNNQAPTPATEWIEDLATPLRTKREEMRRLMPGGMRRAVREARGGMRDQEHAPKGVRTIRGGIAPVAAYVSWVDELVWHATPSIGGRGAVHGFMDYLLLRPEEYWGDHKLNVHRALRFLATFPDTLIGEMNEERKRKLQWGFETKFVDSYMNSVVKANGEQGVNYGRHMKDVQAHLAALQSAPISLSVGQELASDPDGVGTAEFNQRTRIHRRTKRANSVGDLKALQTAHQDNSRRSFLRTWVRVRKVS